MKRSFLITRRSPSFPPSLVDDRNHPTVYSITEDKIDINDLLVQITMTSTGAAAIFTGMVRGLTTRNDPHETEYLEYESCKPMAEEKMKQIVDEIRQRSSAFVLVW